MDLSSASTLHLLECRVQQLSPHTLLIYEQGERRFVEWLRSTDRLPTLAALSVGNARLFLDWLGTEHQTVVLGHVRPHGPQSLYQHAQVLRTWAGFLTREGLYPGGDPLKGLKLPRVPSREIPRFTLEQIELLATCCARTRYPLRNRAIVLLLADTGVRASELCSLQLPDVVLATSKHPGRARVLGKGNKERFVYLGSRTSQAIQRYLAAERPESRQPWLFAVGNGRRLSRAIVDATIRNLGRAALIKDVRCSAHTFRHSFALLYLQRNPGQILQLQALLGHSSMIQTQHYARLAAADVERSWSSVLDG